MKPSDFSIVIRQPYDTLGDSVSESTSLKCEDESLTQQQFKDESSLDFILNRYALTGILPDQSVKPIFDDLVGISTDYHEALDLVLRAEDSFYDLPSSLRERFLNDPRSLIRFLDDPNNRDEAVKLGLIDPSPDAPASPAPASPAEGG